MHKIYNRIYTVGLKCLSPEGISLGKGDIIMVQKLEGKGMFFSLRQGPVGTAFRGTI